MPWLTPNAEDGIVYRLLRIPAPLLHVVNGALAQLEFVYNWEQFGDMTPEEAVEAASQMMDTYFGGNMFVGMSMPWFGDANELPDNLLICDGSIYDRVDYPRLYAVLASPYVIDADTFRTPNLIGRFPLGATTNTGNTGGASTHTLTANEMPPHSHDIPGSSCFPYGEIPEVCVTGGILTQNSGSAGGGEAHNNMPPYIEMVYVIIAR